MPKYVARVIDDAILAGASEHSAAREDCHPGQSFGERQPGETCRIRHLGPQFTQRHTFPSGHAL